ncbi:MAG: cytochrome c peroxidase [Bacteroidota bacterium]
MKKYAATFPIFPLLIVLFGLLACTEPDPFLIPNPPSDTYEAENQILAKTLNLPEAAFDYPSGFEVLSFPFESAAQANPHLATLGRVLFYEKALSADGTVSCASCHAQELAFSDNVAFSEGVYGNITDRNSFPLGSFPSLAGGYAIPLNFFTPDSNGQIVNNPDSLTLPGVFWDERAVDFHEQMTETLANEKEMGIDVGSIPDRLSKLEYYPILFQRAFNASARTPNTQNTLIALEAFMQSFVNLRSPFDDALSASIMTNDTVAMLENFPSFTEEQNLGKQLFLANCGSCHASSLNFRFTQLQKTFRFSTCNGLDMQYQDKGVGDHSGDPEKDGFFKIPSLRNITETGPYMHDGRFATLEEVIQHYNQGIQPHRNLDPLLKDEFGQPLRLDLSQSDVDAMLAFFETLKDDNLLTHERWSDPFK